MRLISILILASALQVSARGYAQKVTLDKHNATLEEVLNAIHEQTGYFFLYDNRALKGLSGIDIDVKRATLQEALDKSIAKYSLGYLLEDKTILVFPKEATMQYLKPSRVVEGTVHDDKGLALAGVTVRIKNSNVGTITDQNGHFGLDIPDDNTVLQFSFLGFETQEVTVGSRSNLSIQMQASSSSLDQLVVIGYGTQKKADLTGAVATIDSKELESRPVTNVSTALAGLAPGMAVKQNSGDPRSDGAAIHLRGIGTLNNSAPLVIIDGIQGNIDAINPNDIANISILKDAASAAIYGAEAANGVILITTKKGKRGAPHVSYTGLFSTSQPINLPRFVTNYARHMRLINEGETNLGQQPIFSQNTIDAWEQAAKNPNGKTDKGIPNAIAYPNTDWGKAIFEHNIVQNHNLSVNGGGDDVRYLLSAGYLKNPGTMESTQNERYQLRANIEANIGKHITVGTQTFASLQHMGKGSTSDAFNFLRQTTPGVVPEYEGKFGTAQAPEESATANNILQKLETHGGKDQISRFNTTLYSSINIIKGLTLDSKFNYQTSFEEENSYPIPFEQWNFLQNILVAPAQTPDQMTTSYSYTKNYSITFNHVLHYNTNIADAHQINLMAGYEEYYYNRYYFNAAKKGLIDPSITTLGSANEMTSIGGDETDHARRSLFGRANYSYKGKYLLEGNLRYDGSSRFASESRWGIFPSLSAGWRISEEDFFKNLRTDIQDLKVRASWGKLGNNRISQYEYQNNYDYQATYQGGNYSFNGVPETGLAQNKLANAALQWESTTVTDIGLDLTMLSSRMNLTLDYYNKQTDGILTTPPIHLTMGTVGAPTRNTAGVQNKGFEVGLGWQDKIGDFHFSVNGNFAYNFNEVTKYKGKLKEGYVTDENGDKQYVSNLGDVSSGGTTRVLEDHTINEYYMQTLYRGNGTYKNADGSVNPKGGPRDGMIRTPEDMAWLQAMVDAGYTFLPVGAIGQTKIYYGDFIYADNNGDGIYGNSYDQQFTGSSSTPKYIFGLSASASWNGFDFSMLWSGSAAMKYYWLSGQGYNSNVVRNGFSTGVLVADNHYYYDESDPKNPANNIDGKYPRLKYNSDPQNDIASTFWLYNASYIKLKNIQLGYTLPERWVSKAWMSSARIFISAENLLMITEYPGIDPEIGAGEVYPSMKQIALGVNVTF